MQYLLELIVTHIKGTFILGFLLVEDNGFILSTYFGVCHPNILNVSPNDVSNRQLTIFECQIQIFHISIDSLCRSFGWSIFLAIFFLLKGLFMSRP